MILKIQKFTSDFVNIILSLIRVAILSKYRIVLPKGESEILYILGNGPSLRNTLAENADKLKEQPLLVVNNFIFSDHYTDLKPSYYVLNAPEYFMEIPPTENHLHMRERTFSSLVEKTNWPLYLFVPALAAKTAFWRNKLKVNSNIKIIYYNTAPVEGPAWFTNKVFAWNLGMSRPHNVLIPSLFLGINMGYKKILIFGADHSWHEEIRISDTNNVMVNHEHFYDQTKMVAPMHKLDGQQYYMHDVLRKLYLAFRGYFEIKNYAAFKGSVILNASKKSYIDAFEKIKF